MADADIIAIGNPLTRRETASGKARYRIDVESEPILVNLNEKEIGVPVALAIADALRKKVLAIAESAPAATLKARKVAAKAFAEGKSWATKRYAGGRIGAMAPNQSDKAFNDSGRFAKSIAAAWRGDKFIINAAGNRLDEATGNIDRIWARLVSLVPAFADPGLIAADEGVQIGINQAVGAAIVKAEKTGNELSVARMKNAFGLIKSIVKALGELAETG